MSESCIGINIKEESIYLIQANKSGSEISISEMARIPLPDGLVNRGVIQDSSKLASILKNVISSSKFNFTSERCVFSFSESEGFVMSLQIQDYTTDKEIVDMGLKKFRGLVDNANFKFLVNRFSSTESQFAHLVAVRNEILLDLIQIGRSVGLEVVGIEVESQAKVRGFVERMSNAGIIVLSLGYRSSVVSIHDIYGLNFSTLLPVSGEKIDSKISSALEINQIEAKKLRMKEGLLTQTKSGKIIYEIITDYLVRAVSELRIAIKNYERNFESNVKKIILEGQISDTPGLLPFFSEKLDEYVVEKGTVWISLKRNLDRNYLFSAAVGLALKGLNFQNSLNVFNFVEVVEREKKGFLSRLFGRNNKSDFKVRDLERLNIRRDEEEHEQDAEGVSDVPKGISLADLQDKDESEQSEAINKMVEQESIDQSKEAANDIVEEQAANLEKVEEVDRFDKRKLGVLKPVDDDIDVSSETPKPVSVMENQNETNMTKPKPESENNDDMEEVGVLKAITIDDIRAKIKGAYDDTDEETALITQDKILNNGNEKKLTQKSKKIDPAKIKMVDRDKFDKPEDKKKKKRASIKIKKRYLLYILIPIIFLFVIYISQFFINTEPASINFVKSYDVELNEIDTLEYNIETVQGDFRIEVDKISGTGQVIDNYLNEQLDEVGFADLEYSLSEDYIPAEDLANINLEDYETRDNSFIIIFEAIIVVVDEDSLLNFVNSDLEDELAQRGLDNYVIKRDSAKTLLNIDKNSGTININVTGKVIQEE